MSVYFVKYCPKCGRKFVYTEDGFYRAEYDKKVGVVPVHYFKCPVCKIIIREIIELEEKIGE